MSGFLLFIVAIALLGVAVYSLVSYIKERRAGQLPTDKKKEINSLCQSLHPGCVLPGKKPISRSASSRLYNKIQLNTPYVDMPY